MNYSELVKAIDEATGFDLYRRYVAIGRMLDDPLRVIEVRRAVRVGEEVEYFEPTENRAVRARLVRFQRTRVVVENLHDKKRWNIPCYAINIHKVDTHITQKSKRKGLGKNEVCVGDIIGFADRDNVERYGKVIRLNQKTVTMECDGGQWRVSYGLIFKVICAND